MAGSDGGQSDVGDHGPEKVLEVGVQPPVHDGVSDCARHGNHVDHKKCHVLNLR